MARTPSLVTLLYTTACGGQLSTRSSSSSSSSSSSRTDRWVHFQQNAGLSSSRTDFNRLSGHTDSALVWHHRGRVLEPRLVQQVLRFVDRVNTVQYMELGGYCP